MMSCKTTFRISTQGCRMFQNPAADRTGFRMFQFLANSFRRCFHSKGNIGNETGSGT